MKYDAISMICKKNANLSKNRLYGQCDTCIRRYTRYHNDAIVTSSSSHSSCILSTRQI